MSTASEQAQFRRLIGDYTKNKVEPEVIEAYLDDAARELTANDPTNLSAPVIAFSALEVRYHPEVVVKAAINWWWNVAAEASTKHSQTVGPATQNVSETWDRAMEMISRLEEQYQKIQTLGTDITVGNISRFSKVTLTRVGGKREENALD